MRHGYIQLRAALDGSFEYEIEAARGNVINALGLSMEELADELVSKLRQDFLSSGLSRAAALQGAAWRRDEIFGKGKSLNPAAWIYSRMPVVVSAFEQGRPVRGRGMKGLLVPNPAVWPNGRYQRARSGLSRGLSIWDAAVVRFGPLRVVRRPGRTTLVVAEVRESATNGRFRKASASALRRAAEGKATGLVTIVVFVLAKEARQPRLLRGNTIRDRARQNSPGRMDQLFQKYFADIDQRGARRIGRSARPAAPVGGGFAIGGG